MGTRRGITCTEGIGVDGLRRVTRALVFLRRGRFSSLRRLRRRSSAVSGRVSGLSSRGGGLRSRVTSLGAGVRCLKRCRMGGGCFSSVLGSSGGTSCQGARSSGVTRCSRTQGFLGSICPSDSCPSLGRLGGREGRVLASCGSLGDSVRSLCGRGRGLGVMSRGSRRLLSRGRMVSERGLRL